jgi:hypothetical protein
MTIPATFLVSFPVFFLMGSPGQPLSSLSAPGGLWYDKDGEWMPRRSASTKEGDAMLKQQTISSSKRKRLLKMYGPCPTGYTTEDLERFLDLLYGMYSHVYTLSDLRQMVVCDPFDRSEQPRQLKLLDLADWLEALVS